MTDPLNFSFKFFSALYLLLRGTVFSFIQCNFTSRSTVYTLSNWNAFLKLIDRLYKMTVGAGLHAWWHYLNTWQRGWSLCGLALLIINGSNCVGHRCRAAFPAAAVAAAASRAALPHCAPGGMLLSILASAPICFWNTRQCVTYVLSAPATLYRRRYKRLPFQIDKLLPLSLTGIRRRWP